MLMAGVVEGRGLRRADHDQAAVGGLQHLDRHSVEPAQRRGRDHFAWWPLDAATAGEVDDPVEHLVDPLPGFAARAAEHPGQWYSPVGAVETEPDDVAPADPGSLIEAAALGQIADPGVHLARRRAENGRVPLTRCEQAEDQVRQSRFAG